MDSDLPEKPVRRAIPQRFVLVGVGLAGIVSWVLAGSAAVRAWTSAFPADGGRVDSFGTQYAVLALLCAALLSLPFTFLQWAAPERRERWRSIGGGLGVAVCIGFWIVWAVH